MSSTNRAGKGWHVTLWIVQILLAFAFGMAGFTKATQPFDALSKMMPWTTAVGEPLVRFVGIMELTGALGLLLPAATRLLPFLTPLAGVGLTTVMVLASGLHATRGEYGIIPVNAVLGSLAVFVAWGRFRRAPIAARGASAANVATA